MVRSIKVSTNGSVVLPHIFQITPRLVCPICPYKDTACMNMQLKHYMAHIRDCHSSLPGFSITCGMYGCPQQFHTWNTFRSHVYDRHGSHPCITNQQPRVPGSAADPQAVGSAHLENADDNDVTSWTRADYQGIGKSICICMKEPLS